MGLSWRKFMKLIPGVRLTFSKRGASVSAGPPHVKTGVDSRGTRRASLSLFGFSWRKSRRRDDAG